MPGAEPSQSIHPRPTQGRQDRSLDLYLHTQLAPQSYFTDLGASSFVLLWNPEVISYSGGTEATAFNPRAVTAMRKTGLRIVADDPAASNPRYRVCVGDTDTGFECFSKVFHEPPNPTNGYCAVMTCSQADDACPVVMGCDLRVPIRYEDPKVADDTPQESERYEERVRQIGREMLWMLKHSS